jgi:hypothetical protein
MNSKFVLFTTLLTTFAKVFCQDFEFSTFAMNIAKHEARSVNFLSDFNSEQKTNFVEELMETGFDVKLFDLNQKVLRADCNDLHPKEYPTKSAELTVVWVSNEYLVEALEILNSSVVICPLRIDLGFYSLDNIVFFVVDVSDDAQEYTKVVFQDEMVQLHKQTGVLRQFRTGLVLDRYEKCTNKVRHLGLFSSNSTSLLDSREIFPSYDMFGHKLVVSILPIGYLVAADEFAQPR